MGVFEKNSLMAKNLAKSDRVTIVKFGGKLLSSPEAIKEIAEYIVCHEKYPYVVVVSAMRDTTDTLYNLVEGIGSFSSDNTEVSKLLSVGEQISAALFALTLQKFGYSSISYNAYDLKLIIDENNSEFSVDIDLLKSNFCKGVIPIVCGFQALNTQGRVITLDRGGSDLTAVAICALLKQKKCKLYKDVDQIYNANPKFFSDLIPLDHISYDELIDMTLHGAEIVQTHAISLAKRHNIEILIKNVNNENSTCISSKFSSLNSKKRRIKITHCPVNLVTLEVNQFFISRHEKIINNLKALHILSHDFSKSFFKVVYLVNKYHKNYIANIKKQLITNFKYSVEGSMMLITILCNQECFDLYKNIEKFLINKDIFFSYLNIKGNNIYLLADDEHVKLINTYLSNFTNLSFCKSSCNVSELCSL